MAVMTQKKKDLLNALVSYADKGAAMTREVQELIDYFTDNGFATGGANAIVDADCTDSNSHLSQQLVNDAIVALGNVNLTPAQKTTLRKVATVVVPK